MSLKPYCWTILLKYRVYVLFQGYYYSIIYSTKLCKNMKKKYNILNQLKLKKQIFP